MRLGADLLFFLRSLPTKPGSNGDAFDPKSNTQYPHAIVLETAMEYFSSHVMTLIYLCFTLMLSTKMTVGHSAVQCWVPQQFTKSWEEFTEQICWMSPKTVWTSQNPWKTQVATIRPEDHAPEHERHITMSYYQWMPYCFLLWAVLHPMPSFVWRLLVAKDERYLNQVVQMIASAKKESNEARREQLWQDVCQMSQELFPVPRRGVSYPRQMFASSPMYTPGVRYLSLPFKYILYKIILICWLISQCYFFSRLVQIPKHIFYGSYLLYYQYTYGDLSWHVNGLFPRVARCDFQVHALGHDRWHAVQCSLPMNMLYEKMLTLVWCALWFITIIVSLSLLVFLGRICLHLYGPSRRVPGRIIARSWGQQFVLDRVYMALLDQSLVWEWWKRCDATRPADQTIGNNNQRPPKPYGWDYPPPSLDHKNPEGNEKANVHLV